MLIKETEAVTNDKPTEGMETAETAAETVKPETSEESKPAEEGEVKSGRDQ